MRQEPNSRDGLDREVLFDNERFIIGVLQVVSGGSLIAGISQNTALSALVGRYALLVFLTAIAGVLALAVYAAYAKHEYKMWDVKTGGKQNAIAWLKKMRRAIRWAVWMLIAAITWLLGAAWLQALL